MESPLTKSYVDINREERFYCFLLGHALLASSQFRVRFSELVASRLNGWKLAPHAMQVFVEAAPLRDYWHKLQKRKDDHSKEAFLSKLLKREKIPFDVDWLRNLHPDRYRNSRYISPGRWDKSKIERLKITSVDANIFERLLRLKWAFNAKPDIMILSGESDRPTHGVLIEAKFESREDTYQGTLPPMSQSRLQKKIGELLVEHVEYFSRVSFVHLKILTSRRGNEDILTWSEIANEIEASPDGPGTEIGDFCRLGFETIVRESAHRP